MPAGGSGVGAEAASNSVTAHDAGSGLAILASRSAAACCVAVLGSGRTLLAPQAPHAAPPPSSASTAAPQQVEMTAMQPDKKSEHSLRLGLG